MCRAQRPRTVSPKRNNPNVLVLDLTSNSKSKANGDINVNVASTESARKRQRSKTDTNSDINNSSSRRQRNNRNRDGSSNRDGNRNRKRHNSECTDDSSNASTSRIRNMNIGGDLDKKSISIGSTRDSDINNTATISFVKERTTKSKSKQSKQSSSMVQQTLFGSIVKNIQETDVDVDVSKPQLHVRVVSNKARKYPSNRQTQHDDDDMIDVVDTRHEIDKLEQLDHHSSQPQPQPQKKTRPRTNSKQSYEKLFAKAMKTLHAKFSIPTLRNLQPLAIQSALQGKSQIIVMATGGGKSLCYQLPAAVLPGVTIVVSPLIALMVDQVNALCRKGIEAVMLSSAMGEKEKKIVWKRLVSTGTGKITSTSTGTGTGEKEKENDKNNPTNAKKQVQSTKKEKDIKLLYCTPELIQTTRFRAVLSNLYSRGLLALVAIDEAHCLSTWGHDFRPAYRKLSWIRHSFPDVPCMVRTVHVLYRLVCVCFCSSILIANCYCIPHITYTNLVLTFCTHPTPPPFDSLQACTATATKKVIQDIKQVLCFTSGEECHMSTFNRPNVSYEVRYRDSMGDVEALKDLVKTVQTQHQKAQREGVPCSGIVYVHKRDDTTMISATLQKAGIAAAPYHAGLKDKDRTRIQQEWTDGIINVAIATVAFGMGIDLAHVRYVLHWSMSKTVEGFYQESGRAGRDGLASKSILYYSKGDATKFAFLIRKNSEKNEAKGKKSVGDDHSLDALNKMVEFCTISCCR
jgi:ATP-dependent DNA helicase RecQ